MKLAERDGEPLAAAIFFRGGGRAVRPLLGHASATRTRCISRPAITRASSTASSTGLQRFDPGTQGEHKLARGFEPTRDDLGTLARRRRVSRARSADYLERERAAVDGVHAPRHASTCRSSARTRPAHDPVAAAGRSAGRISAGRDGARRARTDCSASVATCRLRGCSRPIGAAFSLVLGRASPSSGGRRIRARSCCRTNSRSRAAWPSRCATAAYASRVDTAFGDVIAHCAAPATLRPKAPGSRRRCTPPTRAARTGLRALGRDLARRPAGRRPLRRRARAGLLRRVDVQPRARRVESRAHATGRRVASARSRPDRLPGRERAPR